MNTAMLIPFLSQELDLDEFEYHDTYGDSLDDELDSDNDYSNKACLKIPKMKPCVKNSPYTTSPVITPFKPPVHPDSPMLASYGKQR
ncbi:hypothetical protein F8M41_019412 [Gigaspora margarita]|uniref:Uncharacterized protein n=1 Tax=Gigaspora margarita TaxID=4874 RepID=A0A8H4B270_GIGMA|nr:hypothetical protein F8M41_019412 [Gigaspora margarita]